MPLREQEAVAARVVDGLGRHVEDALVEHPDHVERRERGERVLLVAGHPGQQLVDVHMRPIAQVEVNLKSRHPRHDMTRAHHRRAVRALRRGHRAPSATTRTSVSSPHVVRRATSAATSASMLRRLAFIRTAQRVGLTPRGDRGGAGHAAQQPHPHQGRLERASAAAGGPGSTNRSEQLERPARHPRLLHRLRLPQPASLRAEQPRRRGGRRAVRAPSSSTATEGHPGH